MSKYNVGDVVKLRDEAMNDAIGKKAEIKDCYNDKYYAKFASRYGGCWLITDEMIEGLWEECKEKQDKLKLIDVLNMIAKGELKEGTKVKLLHDNTIYKLDCDELVSEEDYKEIFELYSLEVLAEEVELIEPPCEHEWLDWETHRMGEGRIRRYRRCNKCGLEEETEDNHFADVGKMEKIEELEECEFYTEGAIVAKLNEVINKVNAQTTVLLAQDKYIKEIQEQLDY